MTNSNPQLMRIFTAIGLFFVFIPLAIMGFWFYAFNSGASQSERLTVFHSHFPVFLHGQYSISFLSLAFCILAIVFNVISLNSRGKQWEGLNIVIIAISALLLLFNLWQMM